MTANRVWTPDVLEGFEQSELELPDGAVATLVRMRQDAAAAAGAPKAGQTAGPGRGIDRPAVLYLHGFVDYFFQAHLAAAFEARGYRFYAIDLRGYGRSLGRGVGQELENYVPEISVYSQDLDAAAKASAEEQGSDRLVGLGHSTGGLIMPLWAATRPGRLEALLLNSPWLDLNGNWFMRGPATRAIQLLARITPKAAISAIHVHYGRALHQETGGEWDYDLAWKPHDGFKAGLPWLASIRRWQARAQQGLNITEPILVMTSARRGDPAHWHPELLTTDSILDPRQMWRWAPRLGDDVEVRALEGGTHDLALSPEPVRSRFMEESLDWLDRITAA
jgi:alpha-beta hydrolase superfamily lysophospholipase